MLRLPFSRLPYQNAAVKAKNPLLRIRCRLKSDACRDMLARGICRAHDLEEDFDETP